MWRGTCGGVFLLSPDVVGVVWGVFLLSPDVAGDVWGTCGGCFC